MTAIQPADRKRYRRTRHEQQMWSPWEQVYDTAAEIREAAGPALHLMIPGTWQFPPTYGGTNTLSSGCQIGQMHAVQLPLDRAQTISAIGSAMSGSGAGVTMRVGVYADNGNNQPGALLVDAGAIAADGAGSMVWSGLSLAVKPGIYWLVGVMQGAGTPVNMRTWNENGDTQKSYPGFPSGNDSWPESMGIRGPAWSSPLLTVTGALPATFGAAVLPATQYQRTPFLAAKASA